MEGNDKGGFIACTDVEGSEREREKGDGKTWRSAEGGSSADIFQDRLISAKETRRLVGEWVLCYLVHYTGLYATIRGLIAP